MLEKVKEFVSQPMPHKVLYFDEMLTPNLIRLAYWLSLFLIFCTGVARMFSGGFGYFISGILYIAIGALGARIVAELVILLFKMNDRLDIIAKNTKQATSTTRKKVSKKVTKKTAT